VAAVESREEQASGRRICLGNIDACLPDHLLAVVTERDETIGSIRSVDSDPLGDGVPLPVCLPEEFFLTVCVAEARRLSRVTVDPALAPGAPLS
jgi:hypothetical protein